MYTMNRVLADIVTTVMADIVTKKKIKLKKGRKRKECSLKSQPMQVGVITAMPYLASFLSSHWLL